ncbi:hypothetical protein Q0L85_13870, partial [Staphylococcus aureus]|nr:hypothetical protein [Staphylococcus aureus]
NALLPALLCHQPPATRHCGLIGSVQYIRTIKKKEWKNIFTAREKGGGKNEGKERRNQKAGMKSEKITKKYARIITSVQVRKCQSTA